jgi:hypothetical protein
MLPVLSRRARRHLHPVSRLAWSLGLRQGLPLELPPVARQV